MSYPRRKVFVLMPVEVEIYLPEEESKEIIGNIRMPSRQEVREFLSYSDNGFASYEDARAWYGCC